MSDGEALRRAVIKTPADDTPRLVYADWLDERGDALSARYAEFIRVQVEIHHHPGTNCGTMYCSRRSPEGLCDSCSRYSRLIRRRDELWGSYPEEDDLRGMFHRAFVKNSEWDRHNWCVLPNEDARDGSYEARVRRGFADRIGVTSARLGDRTSDYRDLVLDLFGAHPITSVVVADARPYAGYADGGAVWFRNMSDQQNFNYVSMYDEDEDVMHNDVPGEVFDLLELGTTGGHFFVINKFSDRRYKTADEALQDLSNAIVKLGRKHAGVD